MKKIYNLFLFAFVMQPSLHAQTLRTDVLYPNGPVNSVVRKGNTLYLGGSFSFVGKKTPKVANIDHYLGTVKASGSYPVDGDVTQVISDNNGGFIYIGNFFGIEVGNNNSIFHPRLVKINPDGSLNPAYADITGGGTRAAPETGLYAVAANKDRIYVGGSFTNINGSARANIAVLDAQTGAVLNIPISVNGRVYDLDLLDNTLYVAGDFILANSQQRNSLAAFNATTGEVLAWTPNHNLSQTFRTVKAVGSTVYFGGSFNTFDGIPRGNGAAVDATTGALTKWNPNANGTITDIFAREGIVVPVGSFTQVRGRAMPGIAFLDDREGNFLPWAGDLGLGSGTINSVAFQDNTIYAGGTFTSIKGQLRERLAGLNATTGEVTAWNPDADQVVRSVAAYGTSVFAVGAFTSIGGGGARSNLAAIDLITGKLTDWNPGTNGVVNVVFVQGSGAIMAGGDFTMIGGQQRRSVGMVDAITGEVTAFDAHISSGIVNALGDAISGHFVYIGGSFSQVGGDTRINLAAVNDWDGALWAHWRCDVGTAGLSVVNTLRAVDGGSLYIGGSFSAVGGQPRRNIAKIVEGEGTVMDWRADANEPVHIIRSKANTILVGGKFTMLNGLFRNRLGALDTATAAVLPWNPNPANVYGSNEFNTEVRSLGVNNNIVYAGGIFTRLGGQERYHLGSVDGTTGLATSWKPDPGGEDNNVNIFSVLADNDGVYVGGRFTNIGYRHVEYFAIFNHSVATRTAPTLLSLSGDVSNFGNQLSWNTNSTEGSRFIIERSSNGSDFKEAGYIIEDRNPSMRKFHFADENTEGQLYYRIKSETRSGKLVYSNTVKLDARGSFGLYPNPVGSSSKLFLKSSTGGTVRYHVVNMNGGVVKQGVVTVQKGENLLSIDLNTLPAGTYLINVLENGNTRAVKFIKK